MANLPYFAISQAFRHREVQKDCQKRKREIGYIPLENCPFLKTAYFFPCGCGFNQTKKREKVVNVSLFNAWDLESGMRNSQRFSFVICGKSFRIYNIFLFFVF